MADIIRVLRVLEYVGDREAVEANLNKRGVKESLEVKNLRITESILGETSEILTPEEIGAKTGITAKSYILDQIGDIIETLISVCEKGISCEESEVILAAIEKGRCLSTSSTLEEATKVFKALVLVSTIVKGVEE